MISYENISQPPLKKNNLRLFDYVRELRSRAPMKPKGFMTELFYKFTLSKKFKWGRRDFYLAPVP